MRDFIPEIKSATFAIAQGDKIIGTCFISDTNNCIITARHVVFDRHSNKISSLKILDHQNKKHDFIIVGHDPGSDIAILESHSLNAENKLEMGDYSDIQEGDEILLCGFPFGSKYHVTHKGMISAKSIINGRESIQIDASVNQGNSGGPCIIIMDNKIKVVGVIVTRLVGANLDVFHDNHKQLNASLQKEKDDTKKGWFKVFMTLFNVFSPILAELDRFINVGFGEAVSINYVKNWIEHNQA